jgi:hypothetical protein
MNAIVDAERTQSCWSDNSIYDEATVIEGAILSSSSKGVAVEVRCRRANGRTVMVTATRLALSSERRRRLRARLALTFSADVFFSRDLPNGLKIQRDWHLGAH